MHVVRVPPYSVALAAAIAALLATMPGTGSQLPIVPQPPPAPSRELRLVGKRPASHRATSSTATNRARVASAAAPEPMAPATRNVSPRGSVAAPPVPHLPAPAPVPVATAAKSVPQHAAEERAITIVKSARQCLFPKGSSPVVGPPRLPSSPPPASAYAKRDVDNDEHDEDHDDGITTAPWRQTRKFSPWAVLEQSPHTPPDDDGDDEEARRDNVKEELPDDEDGDDCGVKGPVMLPIDDAFWDPRFHDTMNYRQANRIKEHIEWAKEEIKQNKQHLKDHGWYDEPPVQEQKRGGQHEKAKLIIDMVLAGNLDALVEHCWSKEGLDYSEWLRNRKKKLSYKRHKTNRWNKDKGKRAIAKG